MSTTLTVAVAVVVAAALAAAVAIAELTVVCLWVGFFFASDSVLRQLL